MLCLIEGSFIAIRERILGSHLSRTEQEDILRQLVALQDEPLEKLGRKALWEEFKAGAWLIRVNFRKLTPRQRLMELLAVTDLAEKSRTPKGET